jgi:predicted DCC family thiol-disulfide oxidoreductase YuxK
MDLLLYDGVCGLCNRLVRFVLDRDPKGRFRFASLQSPLAAELLARYHYDPADLDTFYAVIDFRTPAERVLKKGKAAVYVGSHLKGLWPLTGVGRVVPRFLLDLGYDFVAHRRYGWFGKLDACPMPKPGDAERFFDQAA